MPLRYSPMEAKSESAKQKIIREKDRFVSFILMVYCFTLSVSRFHRTAPLRCSSMPAFLRDVKQRMMRVKETHWCTALFLSHYFLLYQTWVRQSNGLMFIYHLDGNFYRQFNVVCNRNPNKYKFLEKTSLL